MDIERAAKRLRARLVGELTDAGVLTDPAWRAAFTEVARHRFLPRFFRAGNENRWLAVAEGDPDWLTACYTDQVLVTQLDDDNTRWESARSQGGVTGTPTSSSSMPSIMAAMLEALQLHEQAVVLEIGTGSGYNAALLCHRLGEDRVSTMDIDEELVRGAAGRLARAGYRPHCAVGDGLLGYPDRAPYDRILATCAVGTVPLTWLAQTRRGGLVVTTLHRPLGAGMVRIVAGTGALGEGRVLADDGRFMPVRGHRLPSPGVLAAKLVGVQGTSRHTSLAVGTVVSPSSPYEFYAGLALPGVQPLRSADGALLLLHPDGSWARHWTKHGTHTVAQGGPQRLWDIAELGYARWKELGEPRRERFGITVDEHRQELWLDDPDSPLRWRL